MSGHSKWANIKHRKERQDQKKGKIFSKLSQQISSATRVKGPDPDKNPELALMIEKAKAANMPKENIAKAINKGAGQLEKAGYQSERLEAYGPADIALLIDVSTDNRNRTLSEIKNILKDHQGKLAQKGSVAWKFIRRGRLIIKVKEGQDKEQLLEPIIEAGATDFKELDDGFLIFCRPDRLHSVKQDLIKNKVKISRAEISFEPKNSVVIEDKTQAKKIIELVETLEEHDDIESVNSDFDIPKEILEKT